MEPMAELLGESPGILALREQVTRLLRRHSGTGRLPPILIEGETGTGKGLLARLIHREGPRARGPFVDVNCAAIPETLLEAEMFGFERGAFTDAKHAKPGLLQTAHLGTIFLDEVALLPTALQTKLLKVLEERSVRRLGSTRSQAVDVWILTATNADLARVTREGRFREDLYHRLAVVTLRLPPLRERGHDVLLLAERFLARISADYRLPVKSFTAEARAALLTYPWPGNVRELANVVERVALLSDAALVTAEALGLARTTGADSPPDASGTPVRSLDDAVRAHLREALERTGWNVSRAAAVLGIARNTLRARIEKHGLRPRAPSRPLRAGASGALAPVAEPLPVAVTGTLAAPGVRWEPRRLTFLRAVLAGAVMGEAPVWLSGALAVVAEKAQSFGGHVEEVSPTGLVAAFGLEPVEDAPRRAAHAAMAIRRAIGAVGGPGPVPLVGLGIHVAQCLVADTPGKAQIALEGKREAWPVLDAIVTAASGEAVVSAAAAPFLERRFELSPLPPPTGAAGVAYRLGDPLPSALGHRLAPFLGRQHDLTLLASRLTSARRGQGQVVGIVGDAGIGKSRLLHEFRQLVASEPVTVRQGACRSYGTAIPYQPIIDLVREHCRILATDGLQATVDKVRSGVELLQVNVDRAAPYLLRLLGVPDGTAGLAGLDAEAVRLQTLELLREMALRGSLGRTLVFAIEDLHWVDRTSEECLTSLVESLAGATILLVCTYRPGYRPPWMDRSYATQIALQPLGAEDSLALLRSVLPTRGVPDPVVDAILRRAEGNPFFLEELSRAVGEQPGDDAPVAVPATVEEVLRARIGRLPDAPRRLLQAAAVIGREVPARLLRAVWQESEDAGPYLKVLLGQEFLTEKAGGGEPVYLFRHALTQEVAYETLTPVSRQARHAAAGRALEAIYRERLEEVYELLAHHYAHSGDANRALHYLTRAAEKAARSHAHTEALTALSRALPYVGLLPPADRDRALVELAVRRAQSLVPLGRFQEVIATLPREEPALARLGDPALSGRHHFLLGRTYSFLGEHEQAIASAQRAIEAARRADDAITVGRAYTLLALEAPLSGRALEGIEHARQAVARLEGTPEQSWLGQAHWVLGLNHASMGEFELALVAHGRAAAIGEAVGDRRLLTFASWGRGTVFAAMGESEAGVDHCRRALQAAPDPLNTAIARGWVGYAWLETGDPAQARPLLEQAAGELGEFRFGQFQGLFTVFLAEALRLGGSIEQATQLAGQALDHMTAARFSYGIGWAQRGLGRIAQSQGSLADAEAHLTTALRTFAPIRARYEQGRTHLDLARVAQARDDTGGAAAHVEAARSLFAALAIPRYVERAREWAAKLSLPKVE